jgi:hypothetical protein
MINISRSALEDLLSQTEANLRFMLKIATVALLLFAICYLWELRGYGFMMPGNRVAFVVVTIGVLAQLAGVLSFATLFPLIRQCGRFRRILTVARLSAKDQVTISPITNSIASGLRTLAIGAFAIWTYEIIYVYAYRYYYDVYHTDGITSWYTLDFVIRTYFHTAAIVAVAYAAWLYYDVQIQAVRERALLTAWLYPLDDSVREPRTG